MFWKKQSRLCIADENTYNTNISIDISSVLKHYEIKVKSISEKANCLNSEFSEVLEFDTIKLDTPKISYQIDNTENLVVLNWRIMNLCFDSYELYIHEKYCLNIPLEDITIKFNEDETYLENNILCTYAISGKLFNAGRNEFYIKAVSNNKYYFNSENSRALWLYKNYPYTNIRIENGKLLYNIDSEYEINYTALTEDFDFPVINKEILDRNLSDHTLWSDPIYVNLYKIHYPRIIHYSTNTAIVVIRIQGYDPCYVGSDPKRLLGYDYNKIEFRFYVNSSTFFSVTRDSNCLDEETFILSSNEINNGRVSTNDIKKVEVVAHKNGYVSSDVYTYEIDN